MFTLNPDLLWIAITGHGWAGAAGLRIGFGDDCAAAGGLVEWHNDIPRFMGDALAVSLLEARGFTANDFALSHPGGALGKRLLLRVSDLMHKEQLVPKVGLKTLIIDALLEIGRSGLGFTAVIDNQQKLAGVYTDGDLRRTLDQKIDVHTTTIDQVMSRKCTTVHANMLAAEAVQLMEEKKISGLLVLDDEQRPIGAFNMHDLLLAGVI